ncbi:Transcription factor Sox-2 [Dissophora globulifera]|nr:Transcription factor Sox-2 [Dissophora globulifera]
MVSSSNSSTKHKSHGSTKTKKIPRPCNSFLIYRKEHAKLFEGLVATELSKRLAEAWAKESNQRKLYFAHLAELEKIEHAVRHPDYKFTPRKRGTGKRALQKAAALARAEAEASLARAESGDATSATSASLSSSGRPRRNVERSNRLLPTATPQYSSHQTYTRSKRAQCMVTAPVDSSWPQNSNATANITSSIFFGPYSTMQWIGTNGSGASTVPSSVQSQSVASSPASTTTLSLSSLPTEGIECKIKVESEFEEEQDRITQAFGHLMSHSDSIDTNRSSTVARGVDSNGSNHSSNPYYLLSQASLPSPPYQEEQSVFGVSTFPSLLSMESFEPECLARDGAQWTATTNAFYPTLSTPSMGSSNPSSMPYFTHLTPPPYRYPPLVYEDCPPSIYFSSEPSELSCSAVDALLSVTSTAPTLYPPVFFTSKQPQQYPNQCASAATQSLTSFSFGITPSSPLLSTPKVADDLVMSPALSACSAMSPNMSKSLLEAQNFLASGLEWL